MLLRSRFAPFVSPVVVGLTLTATPRVAFAQTATALAPANAERQTAPLVHLAATDAQTLADALRSVARQAKVAFVAEGKPYRARNSAPPLAPLVEKWPEGGLPLTEAVRQIASVYDYQAEREGNVFLLRKRYTNADDLPDLPSEELRLAFRDAARASSGLPSATIAPVKFGEQKTPFAWTFYQTLTPAQRAKLTDPAKFLTASELDANQQQMLRDCAQSRFVQNATTGVQAVSQAIEACEQKTTTFDWREHSVPGIRLLGCTARINGADKFSPFAPSGWVFFSFGNNYPKTSADSPDKSAPKPNDYDANHAPLPPPQETGPDSFTLRTLADAFNKSAAKGAPLFAPHKELAEKSVLVVGVQSVPSETLWRAAGTVYGLRAVRTEANGALFLLRPRPRIAQNFAELNASVAASLPPALLRLYQGALVVSENEAVKARPAPEVESPAARELRKMREQSDARFNVPEMLKQTLFHRLRVLLEPRLAASPNGSVLYRTMSREEHDLWTLALTIDRLENLNNLSNESVPATITNFNKGWVHAFTMRGYGDVPARTALSFLAESPSENGESGNADIGNVPPITVP